MNDIVLGDLKQIIRNVENLQELVKSQSFTATKIRKSTDIELTKLKAELERVKKLKKSIYEDYKDELISKEEFLSYREDYQQKETLYSKQIETLEEKKKESVTEDVFETPWLRRLLELKDIEELDRDIIVEMIDQITVYETANLKSHTTSEMNWNIYFQAFTVRTWRKRLSNLNTFLTPHIYWGIHITICVNYNQHMEVRIREPYIREDRKRMTILNLLLR